MRLSFLLGVIGVGIVWITAAAAAGPGRLERDWPRLTGTWATPFRKPAGLAEEHRQRLTFRTQGTDRIVEERLEQRAADGAVHSGVTHSAVLVAAEARERNGATFLVIRPKGQPAGKYDAEVRYALVNGTLRLEGKLGSSSLTGEWKRTGADPARR